MGRTGGAGGGAGVGMLEGVLDDGEAVEQGTPLEPSTSSVTAAAAAADAWSQAPFSSRSKPLPPMDLARG